MYFPLLLQRKDTKGKQPETPFLRKRGLATLREEDKNKRKARVPVQGIKTSKSSGNDNEIEQMVETLLRKQEERKALDLEIAELQEKIRAKKDREI